MVSCLDTGRSFQAGATDPLVLDRSFGIVQ
jgi:hypothetical protein